VRIAQPPGAVFVSMRHGTVMSLRAPRRAGSLPPGCRLRRCSRCCAPNCGRPWLRESASDWAAALQTIRADGLSRVRDLLLPGISALAAPVFDGSGMLVLSLTAIGTTAGLDIALDGTPARALRTAADGLSAQLGARAGRAPV